MSDTNSMRDNDMIADYVRLRCPELLETTDFQLYKLSCVCTSFCKSFGEALKKVDFTKLKDAVDKLNERMNNE